MNLSLTRLAAGLLLTISFLPACKPSQKSVTEVRNLPELTVRPVDERPEYRASVTKLHELIHTALDVRPDWAKRYLYGTATLTMRSWFYATDLVQLDARGMLIDDVRMLSGKDSVALKFNYRNDSLLVNLPKALSAQDTFRLMIRYVARPDELGKVGGSSAISSDKGLYFINPDGKEKNKPRQIWTQGETQSNSVWFPTIDVPNQKTTQEIRITVDSTLVTLSNGLLIKSEINPDGTRSDTWKQSIPHTPYLFMMAIGPYAVVKDYWRGKEVAYYVDKPYEVVARRIFGNTPEMLEFFSKQLGVDYPWEKYSQAVVHDFVSGAMENTSATIHGEFLHRDARELVDGANEDIIAHELYHHWFGDLVTCESWSNLPLNESFATYGEYLWNEHKYGREEADIGLYNDINSYLRESKNKRVDLIRFQYDSREDMFDRHSYAKGGTILHMLRKYTGDEAFFKSLKKYLDDNRFKPAEVHHLRLAFEETTGEDMNWFFNQWFLDKGHAELEFSYDWNDTAKTAVLTIAQKQDLAENPLYRIPLDVDIYLPKSVERKRIVVEKKEQSFEFACTERPEFINADAEKMLTGVRTDKHSNTEWIAMYKRAPLFQDRFDALQAIAKDYKAGTPEAEVMFDALKDKNWRLRVYTLSKLGPIATSEKKDDLRKVLMKMGMNDPKTEVRDASIEALANHYKDDELIAYYSNRVSSDSSFSVLESALTALADLDEAAALKMALKMEADGHRKIRSILAGLYARHGDDKNAAYMGKAVDGATGNAQYGLMQQYGRFLKRCSTSANVSDGLSRIYAVAKSSQSWLVRLGAVQAMTEVSKYSGEQASADGATRDLAAAEAWRKIKTDADLYIDDVKKNETNENLKRMFNSSK